MPRPYTDFSSRCVGQFDDHQVPGSPGQQCSHSSPDFCQSLHEDGWREGGEVGTQAQHHHSVGAPARPPAVPRPMECRAATGAKRTQRGQLCALSAALWPGWCPRPSAALVDMWHVDPPASGLHGGQERRLRGEYKTLHYPPGWNANDSPHFLV